MGRNSEEISIRNLMLYSYIDNCGLQPSEIIEAILRYKSFKKVGLATKPEDGQLELPLKTSEEKRQ